MDRFQKYIVFLLLFPAFNQLLAQSTSELFEDAEYYLASENYNKALPLYKKLLLTDTANCNYNFKVGLCLYNIPKKEEEALPYFSKAVKNTTKKYKEGNKNEKKSPLEAYFYYAKLLQMNSRVKEARDNYILYRDNMDVKDVTNIDYVNQLIQSCETAENMKKTPVATSSHFLSETLSSSSAEYNAVFNGDETVVIFMSDRNGSPGIFYSKKENGQWISPIEITSSLGVRDNYSVSSLSADGKRLYLILANAYTSFIYVSTYDGTKWSASRKLNKYINAATIQTHASESPDGRQLYFTSDRKEGFGKLDIYVSELDTKNQWGPGKNLGNVINTVYNEETPFLSNDYQTLYFSSQGHTNMGGYDIFMSTSNPDNTWEPPQNLGYPINTSDDDVFFVPSKRNGNAYYSLKSEPVKRISMVSFGSLSAEKQCTVKGDISFSDNSKSMENVSIDILNPAGNITQSIKPNNEGTYSATLIPGSYTLQFTAEGYSTLKKPVLISNNLQNNEMVVNAMFNPTSIEKGEFLVIRSILFSYNSDSLDRDARLMLERLILFMKKYPVLSLEIKGYCDNKGPFAYNKKLSLRRAQAVADYFISRGIEPTRFILHGFSDMVTIATNTNPDGSDNPAGRRFNRRVEISVVNYNDTNIINEEIIVPENLKVKEDYKYVICLEESDNLIDKRKWASDLDTSLITIANVDAHYNYLYGKPETKIKALSNLKKINKTVNDAYIMPGRYFEILSTTKTKPSENAFTIQIAAMKRRLEPSSFDKLENVKLHPGSDGLNRYTYGIYKTYNEARKNLEKIKEKGYNDAYVVPVSKFRFDLRDSN
jgi:outer membrane protein OmpA-like peptidoglycan-associated protein/Tol biopolymer transport system component